MSSFMEPPTDLAAARRDTVPSVEISFLWLAVIGVIAFGLWRAGPRGRQWRRVGPGTSGTIYDFLNEDKRKAIEIIVEERAEARDPERATGNRPPE